MRNYVKPESALIALNMNENITASAENSPEEQENKTGYFSDPTGTYLSNSNILWTIFKGATAGLRGIDANMWLTDVLAQTGGNLRDIAVGCTKSVNGN